MQLSTLFLSSGDLIADRRYAWAQELESRGDLKGAAELLQQALELTPAYAPGWFALGELQEKIGDAEAATAAYRKAREADPRDDRGALLNLMRLGASPPTDMPASYVRTLFDTYASKFDRALTEGLNYSAPAVLWQAVGATGRKRFRAMLDLGCGTGLGGVPFRPMVDMLVGVDISPRMLEQAQKKNIYDRLEFGDLLECLGEEKKSGQKFDLVIAADVFAYLPDLAPVSRAAADVMQPGGIFAFTVEANAGEGVSMGQALRFSHSADHIRAALAGAGFHLLGLDSASTRMEKGLPVPGLVAVAQNELSPPLRRRVGEGGS